MPARTLPTASLISCLIVLCAAAVVTGASDDAQIHSALGTHAKPEALVDGPVASFPSMKIFGVDVPRQKAVELSSFQVHVVSSSASSKRRRKHAHGRGMRRKHRKEPNGRHQPFIASDGRVLGKPQLWDHVFRDLLDSCGSSSGEIKNGTNHRYFVNSVGGRNKSVNPIVMVVRRRLARNRSSRAAEAASASRLVYTKERELQLLSGLESRNKTKSHRKPAAEGVINILKKAILNKVMSSGHSGAEMSKSHKNGSILAAAIISPAMLWPSNQKLPPQLLEGSVSGGDRSDAAGPLSKIEVSYEFQVVKYEDSGETGRLGPLSNVRFPSSEFDRRPATAAVVLHAVVGVVLMIAPVIATIILVGLLCRRLRVAVPVSTKMIHKRPREAPACPVKRITKCLSINHSEPVSIKVDICSGRPDGMHPPKQTTV